MNIGEDCLKCLQQKDWTRLNNILSDNNNCDELSDDSAFQVFENYFVTEIQRYEQEGETDLYSLAARLFQLNKQSTSRLKLSETTVIGIAEYLFNKNPTVEYAKILRENPDAQNFLKEDHQKKDKIISDTILGANLNVKVGEKGNLLLHKEIFNSPQEKELYIAAIKVLPENIILPNVALSTIINPKVCELLDKNTSTFFYKSTLDLCVVSNETNLPELFIELDSSWHDKPKNQINDSKKDKIFETAGLKLHRLRKKVNKNMEEVFELFISKNYAS